MDRTRIVRRWRRNMDAADDAEYVEMLATLSEGSVRRNFNPYTDIDWESPEFAVTDNDPRWILPATDPLGRHPWYQAQSRERQIEIGMWRQANVAKVGLHFESILIRGLMNYTFWMPNGSPEYRYCLHESVEECNHTMMFQEWSTVSARTFRGCHGGCGGFHRWFRWWPDHCRWPSSSACSLGRSPSTTRKRTCCAKASRCIRSWNE